MLRRWECDNDLAKNNFTKFEKVKS